MLRRFLNIVVREYDTRLYALHRIVLSKNLFYQTTEHAAAQEACKAEEVVKAEEACKAEEVVKAEKKNGGWPPTFLHYDDLPRPEIFFSSRPAMMKASNFHFFSLLPGQGEGCVMFANPSANVSIYDLDMQTVVAVPPASFPKPTNSITLPITNHSKWSPKGEYDLYVMSTEDGSFEFFNYCRTSISAFPNDWYWRPLPHVPPSIPDSYYTVRPASPPFAAAVVDSSTICASSEEGTYAFDMSRGVWRPVGRWTLPFHGAAEYVPEFSLWFGPEGPNGSSQHRLCAFDLASCATAQEAPASQHAWDYLEGLPDEWYPSLRCLVNLGLGKFCIATRCFHRPPEEEDMEEVKVVGDEVTVLTGVEVVRGGNGLQMIKHKSLHYKLDNMGIHCVL
ncbi:hypothetical protein ACQ4PT_027459 [Festuca glaucescens]